MDFMYEDPFSTALQRLRQLQVPAQMHITSRPSGLVSRSFPFQFLPLLSTSSRGPLRPSTFSTTQNDFAEAIQRSELDTWTFTKEVDNPELQNLARIRGHLDVMAQQLSALGEIEEAHKAEKNVVLEKLEHARVELFTAIDAAMPRITHEKAIVQAALEFVELPGDRERLRSPGLAHKFGERGTVGRGRGNRNSFNGSDSGIAPSKAARRSPRTGSVADSAPRSLNFTDVESSDDEEGSSEDSDEYKYSAVPGSGSVVAMALAAIFAVGVHVKRKGLGVHVRRWRDERLENLKYRATNIGKNQLRRQEESIETKKFHTQQRQHSIAEHRVSNYELQRLDEKDARRMSLTTSERTIGHVDAPQTSNASAHMPSQAWQRVSSPTSNAVMPQTSRSSSPPHSPPRPPSPQRSVISSTNDSVAIGRSNRTNWRWRPHVLLGRG